MRAKGIPFEFVEMDHLDMAACAKATGVAQMPQLEGADGRWLTDTTDIIKHFEASHRGPAFSPADPQVKFLSLLLEDMFDEWLWRSAMYYRWMFKESRVLMGHQIARIFMRNMPAPMFVKRRFVTWRQLRVYMWGDGVAKATAPQTEQLYLDMLNMLEPIFARRPYLFGARPCEADFGLFGPFFRHYFSDPTPAKIMHETAPHTLAWVVRLWGAKPDALKAAAPVTEAPDDLDPLFEMAGRDYLPYLMANDAAVQARTRHVDYTCQGVHWRVPVSPYRASCLNALRTAFVALPAPDQDGVARRLGRPVDMLRTPVTDLTDQQPDTGQKPVNPRWKPNW